MHRVTTETDVRDFTTRLAVALYQRHAGQGLPPLVAAERAMSDTRAAMLDILQTAFDQAGNLVADIRDATASR